MNNYKLAIEYVGTNYCGFQKQGVIPTIQKNIETALEKIYKTRIKVVSAGRTDSGVHARGQVVNYKISHNIDEGSINNALNALLPDTIRVLEVKKVDDSFHARRSAKKRVYIYLFTDEKMPLYLKDRITEVGYPVDMGLLCRVEKLLVGQHDFVYLRNKGSVETSTVKRIYSFKISKLCVNDLYDPNIRYNYYSARIEGNSFLYKMVRNIIGAVLEVNRKKMSLEQFALLADGKNKFKYTTAVAKGLCLTEVKY